MNDDHASALRALILEAEQLLRVADRTPRDQILKNAASLIAELKSLEHAMLRRQAREAKELYG